MVRHIYSNSKAETPAFAGAEGPAHYAALAARLKSCPFAKPTLLFALLIAAMPVLALEPTTPLPSYGRQSWVMENGLPQNTVQVLLQTRDGFVWMGTEVGLVRFDGISFQVFDKTTSPALPGNDVHALLETRDGALWIGTSEGLARWKDGKVDSYTTANGLADTDIRSLAQGEDGVLFAWSSQRLARFEENRFVDTTNSTHFPAGAISAVTSNGQNEIWVTAGEDMAIYRRGRWDAGHMAPSISGGVQFVQAFQDRTAVSSKSTVQIVAGGVVDSRLVVGRELPGTRIQSMLFDRAGTLWIGTNGGLVRWIAENLDRLPVTDPLASASVLSLMEDREGNMWVGTETGGLHILRDQRFKALTVRDGLSSDNTTTVVEDRTGALWVGTSGGGLNVVRSAEAGKYTVSTYTVGKGLPSDVILSLAAAPGGDMWVGTPDGLSRVRGDAVSTYTSADGLPDDFIRSLLVDEDGSLWIATRRGLTHWIGPLSGSSPGSRMETFTQAEGLGSDLVGAMARDSAGDLWIATFAGLSRLHEGKITNFTTADGLSSNVITALLPRARGTLLIGTQDRGWNLWNGQGFERVTRDRLAATSIHAILDDGRNHLWFATGGGIARCDCAGITGAMDGVDCLNWIEFTTADGLTSRETAINSHPSAWQARDGRLWFATPKGLESADPAHFPVNLVPPPVAIERFAVDDRDQALRGAADAISVPAGHNHFQFDYAGLSFVAPQKVRYRFMLEGFDHNWTDAGSRRIAYYTNIPPGRYTFRVQAANNDGVWNTQGAALSFDLRPHFYQTLWFYAVLGLAMGAFVLLLFRLRLLRAEREFRAVLGERNRIAREIHDTLAQGYVGISVQLEVLSELLRHNKTDAAAKHLDKTRGYVREGLADARQSIWSLRSQDATETTLPVQMQRMVEHAGGHGLEAKFSLYGAYRPMPPGTEREILRVAQEAIHNVKKHAEASSVSVQLEYGPAEIALEVRDNGRGFAVDQVARNGKGPESPAGHYGLTGMRERAAVIGGTLEVTSETGAGTTVRLRTPTPKEFKE
jgi:signal transduction histidine kinase/ligand-binding sensor domain-containing protein